MVYGIDGEPEASTFIYAPNKTMASLLTLALALYGLLCIYVAHRLRTLPKEKADRSERVQVFGAPSE